VTKADRCFMAMMGGTDGRRGHFFRWTMVEQGVCNSGVHNVLWKLGRPCKTVACTGELGFHVSKTGSAEAVKGVSHPPPSPPNETHLRSVPSVRKKNLGVILVRGCKGVCPLQHGIWHLAFPSANMHPPISPNTLMGVFTPALP